MWSGGPPQPMSASLGKQDRGGGPCGAPRKLAHRADGTGMVINVHPRGSDQGAGTPRCSRRRRGSAASRLGLPAGRRAGPGGGSDNLRWLAGYRHPRSLSVPPLCGHSLLFPASTPTNPLAPSDPASRPDGCSPRALRLSSTRPLSHSFALSPYSRSLLSPSSLDALSPSPRPPSPPLPLPPDPVLPLPLLLCPLLFAPNHLPLPHPSPPPPLPYLLPLPPPLSPPLLSRPFSSPCHCSPSPLPLPPSPSLPYSPPSYSPAPFTTLLSPLLPPPPPPPRPPLPSPSPLSPLTPHFVPTSRYPPPPSTPPPLFPIPIRIPHCCSLCTSPHCVSVPVPLLPPPTVLLLPPSPSYPPLLVPPPHPPPLLRSPATPTSHFSPPSPPLAGSLTLLCTGTPLPPLPSATS